MNRAMRRASKANGRSMMKQGWSQWEDWTMAGEEIARRHNEFGMRKGRAPERFWKNAMYTVQQFTKSTPWGEVKHLLVRRNDEGPVRSWHDLQRVKNELMGPDRVAVEVFPRDEELVDDANIYHLWVLPEGFHLPFGLH